MRLFSPSKKDKKAKEKKKDSVDTPGKGKQNAPSPAPSSPTVSQPSAPANVPSEPGEKPSAGTDLPIGSDGNEKKQSISSSSGGGGGSGIAPSSGKTALEHVVVREQRCYPLRWAEPTPTARGAPGERKGNRVFLAWAIDAAKELASAEGRGEKIPFALDVSCCRIKSLASVPEPARAYHDGLAAASNAEVQSAQDVEEKVGGRQPGGEGKGEKGEGKDAADEETNANGAEAGPTAGATAAKDSADEPARGAGSAASPNSPSSGENVAPGKDEGQPLLPPLAEGGGAKGSKDEGGDAKTEASTAITAGNSTLVAMDLSVNRIRKLGFLSVLPDSLVVLDLSGNMLKNLGDLSVLPHLKDLMCEDNFLEELSFLRTCTQLRRLSLAGNRITSIGVLSPLPNLEEFIISNNVINDASPLSGDDDAGVKTPFPMLASLDLSGNALPSWPIFSKSLPNLRHLNISRNQMKSFNELCRTLGALGQKLQSVNVLDNPFDDAPAGVLNLNEVLRSRLVVGRPGLKTVNLISAVDENDEARAIEKIKKQAEMDTTQRITDEYGKRIDDQRRKLQQTMDLLNEKQREAATNFQQFCTAMQAQMEDEVRHVQKQHAEVGSEETTASSHPPVVHADENVAVIAVVNGSEEKNGEEDCNEQHQEEKKQEECEGEEKEKEGGSRMWVL